MNIQITQTIKAPTGFYFSATCEKVSATVAIHSYGVQVVCQNAAHKVWRGSGKFFPTIAAAIDNYKSGEMKAIIQAAADMQHTVPAITH